MKTSGQFNNAGQTMNSLTTFLKTCKQSYEKKAHELDYLLNVVNIAIVIIQNNSLN